MTKLELSHAGIRAKVLEIAGQTLNGLVVDALVEDDIDLDGAPCLRVTFVLKPHAALLKRGVDLGKISLAIIDFLNEHDDPRYPYTHYATRADLKEAAKAYG